MYDIKSNAVNLDFGATAVHLSLHPHKHFVVLALVASLWSLPPLGFQKSPSTSDLQFKWKYAEQARWCIPADYSPAHQQAISVTILLQTPQTKNFPERLEIPRCLRLTDLHINSWLEDWRELRTFP